MTESGQKFDVIIVGAGPVGLCLAKGLAQDNRSVLVLEKKEKLSQHSKAATVWPRAQEVLSRLGIIEIFQANGFRHREITLWDCDPKIEKKLFTLPISELKNETAFPELLVLPQDRTELILFESLQLEKNAEVKFSAEVVDVQEEADGVRVQYLKDGQALVARASFVVGCDGAHSIVREKLGLKLEGITYPFRAGLVDIRLADNHSYVSPRVSTKHGIAVAIQISFDMWRLIIINRVDETKSLEEMANTAALSLFGQNKFETIWLSQFNLHRRMSEHFSKGRMVLAGDAAHLNSPLGGQGMNAGIIDTEVLRKSLNAALKLQSAQTLEAYAKNRRLHIDQGVNRFTGMMTSVLFSGGGKRVKMVLKTLNLVLKVRFFRKKFLRKATMLDA